MRLQQARSITASGQPAAGLEAHGDTFPYGMHDPVITGLMSVEVYEGEVPPFTLRDRLSTLA